MVKRNKRNNSFFLFERKDKTQGYMGELGLEIIMTTIPDNEARNACWYFLMHTEIICKRTELPL
jgi:hypothetical protein